MCIQKKPQHTNVPLCDARKMEYLQTVVRFSELFLQTYLRYQVPYLSRSKLPIWCHIVAWGLQLYKIRDSGTGVSLRICKILKNNFSYRTSLVAGSVTLSLCISTDCSVFLYHIKTVNTFSPVRRKDMNKQSHFSNVKQRKCWWQP